MELDDLKNEWQTHQSTHTSTSKNKIMELSQQKSHGPVASLKAALTRQAVIIPFLFAVLIIQVLTTPDLRTDPFLGLFVAVIILACIFFSVVHVILGMMGKTDAPVADQLQRQLRSLRRMLWFYRFISLAGVVILVIFIEAFRNEGTAQLMEPWYRVDLSVRIGGYAVLIVMSVLLSRSRFYKDFGKHLDELKKSLSDTELR